MSFHEAAIFPRLGNGSSGGPGFNTNVLDSKGGAVLRVARWDGARRQYDAQSDVITPEHWAELLDFYIAREGSTHGFRFLDWTDYSTGTSHIIRSDGTGTPAFDDQIIGTGDGTTTQFQLVKRYTSGSVTRTRNLTKPIAGTVKSGVAGVEKTEGTHWTVDTTTGTVTYASAPTLGQQVTAGCQFHVPAIFGPGADALLALTLRSFSARGVPAVPIVEDVDPSLVIDEYPWGGAFEASFSIPYQVTPLMGRLGALTPGAATDLLVPAPALFDAGGPHMVFTNLSGTHTVTVKSGATTIGTLAAGATKELDVWLVSTVKAWRLH